MFYGWIIAGSGFLISLFGLGTRYSYGVFLKSIESELGMTRTAASTVFSVSMLLSCIIAILGGWGMDRFGPRKVGIVMGTFTGLSYFLTSQVGSPWQLLITYSLLFSIGTGAIYVIANSTVTRWFIKKRGLVVGITSSGGGVGTIFFAPFAAYLISSFDWRTAFIVLGLVSWIGITAASLPFKKDPGDIGLLPDGAESGPPERNRIKAGGIPRHDLSLGQAYRTNQFWLLGLSWAFLSFSMHLIFVHIVPYAIDTGISPIDASFILSLLGISDIMGRIVLGRLSDAVGRRPLAVAGVLVQFGVLLWLIWARQFWMLYAFALLYGFTFGGSSTMITIFIGDIFGTRRLGAIMGILISGFALGAAAGPAVAGYIFDVSGHYSMAFATGAVSILIAGCLITGIRPVHSTKG